MGNSRILSFEKPHVSGLTGNCFPLLRTATYNTAMRIVWRRVLPLAQLAAYVLLVWYGCWYRPTWEQWFQARRSHSPEIPLYPTSIDGIEPVPEQLAAGLNFPAVAVAALSLVPFDNYLRDGASRDFAMHVLSVIYTPLLWFLIGKRLDRRARIKAASLSRRRKVSAVAALAGLLLAANLMLWFLIEGQRYTVAALSLAWLLSGIMVIWFRLRQSTFTSG
jgi:hypothetical protein